MFWKKKKAKAKAKAELVSVEMKPHESRLWTDSSICVFTSLRV